MKRYLVERYLPGKSAADVEGEAHRLAGAAAALAAAGRRIEYHGSVYVPAEESCFCQLSGSLADVHDACAQADVLGARVVEAVAIDEDGR